MEALKESLDQKRRELAKLGAENLRSWGQGGGSEGYKTYGTMTRPDPKEALGTLAIKHNYAPEGHQFKNSTSWDVSFSFRAPDTGADKISGRQRPEHQSVGSSSDKSVQEQEPGPEQEARNNVQKERKQKTKSWQQQMETEEGAKEVRVMVQARTGPCPVCKERHFYQRKVPWGSLLWPSDRLTEC